MARQTPTITEAGEEWLRARRAYCKPNTLKGDREFINRLAREVKDVQVGHLTVRHMEDFFYDHLGDLSAPTHNVFLYRARQFLTFCQRRGYCRTLCGLESIRNKRTEQRQRLQLSARELLNLLDYAADPRDRAMLAFAMNTGLRSSEIVSIRLHDLDLERGEFLVNIHKTRDADRQPITSDLDRELRRWLTVYTEEVGPLSPSSYLFPSKGRDVFRGCDEHGRPIRSKGAYSPGTHVYKPERVVQRALRNAGWGPEEVRYEGFHTVRRSVARIYFDLAAEKGSDLALRETAALLHHSSTVTTERYLGITSERAARDRRMRGRPFLTGIVQTHDTDKIVPIERGRYGEASA